MLIRQLGCRTYAQNNESKQLCNWLKNNYDPVRSYANTSVMADNIGRAVLRNSMTIIARDITQLLVIGSQQLFGDMVIKLRQLYEFSELHRTRGNNGDDSAQYYSW